MIHPVQSTHLLGLRCSGFRDTAGGCSTPQTPPPIALGLLAGSSAKGTGDKNNKERTALIREYYELVGKASKLDFDFDGDVCVYAEDKEGKTDSSSFCVFVALHVGGSKYKMISANELGKAYEDNLVKFIGKTLPNDLTVLEHGVRNLKKQISLDKSQPDSLRKEMQVQLAIPLKHKQVEVIEMDNSDDAPL